MASNKNNKSPLNFRCLLPFYLCCLKARKNLQLLCVYSLIKLITVLRRNMSFLCLLCPVRKWDVVSDYQMFISCQEYCMFCDGHWHTGYCCYQDLDSQEDRNSVWVAVGDAVFDLRQLFLDQIVTYTEQRQPVPSCQSELHSSLSLLCISSARLSPFSNFIYP